MRVNEGEEPNCSATGSWSKHRGNQIPHQQVKQVASSPMTFSFLNMADQIPGTGAEYERIVLRFSPTHGNGVNDGS